MAPGSNAPAERSPDGESPIAAERERVVQVLSAHFAHDHLTLTEFERRLERAYAVTSPDQLRSVIADLPAVPGPPPTAAARGAATSDVPALVPSSEVPPRGAIFAVMGGAERGGSWIVPRHLKVVALMGGAELDLREARFGPGITEIEVFAVMGGVAIIVPPGVRVESVGAAFLGGFELKAGDAAALSAANPRLRLSGLAVLGGVETQTRLPGESARDAKRRRRRERRDL